MHNRPFALEERRNWGIHRVMGLVLTANIGVKPPFATLKRISAHDGRLPGAKKLEIPPQTGGMAPLPTPPCAPPSSSPRSFAMSCGSPDLTGSRVLLLAGFFALVSAASGDVSGAVFGLLDRCRGRDRAARRRAPEGGQQAGHALADRKPALSHGGRAGIRRVSHGELRDVDPMMKLAKSTLAAQARQAGLDADQFIAEFPTALRILYLGVAFLDHPLSGRHEHLLRPAQGRGREGPLSRIIRPSRSGARPPGSRASRFSS